MIWHRYQLESTVLKTTEPITLWKTEKGLIEIDANALALPIKHDNQRKGYIFHGCGKLLLDAIVETQKGAVGKPIEKEIKEPFIMLGAKEEVGQRLTTANSEDLAKMGYETQEAFFRKAEDLYDRLLRNIRVGPRCEKGLIFAFQNKAHSFLVTKGSKLVYKAAGIIFVSDEDKVVLKSLDGIALLRNGKSVIIQK
ncbi:MAG: hypothetical protein QXN63_00905 [Candidatus Bathyarchaeia archaeon]